MAATTAAVVGTTSAVLGTVMSFTQAAQQQRNIREAQAKADQAMQEARKKLEVNYYEQLGINREKYDLERDALRGQGAQLIEASREADRGAAATAGRLQAMQNEAQAGVRTAMGKELMDLEALTATEESRLRDVGVQLDMGEIAGAQQAMSDAEQARSAAIQQGMQGIGNIAKSVDKFIPLFPDTGKKGPAGGSQMTAGGGSITGGSKMTGGGSLSQQQQQLQQQTQNQIAPQRFLFENYNVQNMFNQGTQPNYQFGGTLPASMGGQYDPFNLFK